MGCSKSPKENTSAGEWKEKVQWEGEETVTLSLDRVRWVR